MISCHTPDLTISHILRLLAISSPPVVNGCVITLYRLGYARPEEWSRPLPTVNPNEVMRILTKRMTLVEQERE